MVCYSRGKGEEPWTLGRVEPQTPGGVGLLYGSLIIVRDELERRSRRSTAVNCGIGERRTLCHEEPAFRHFCKYVTT